MSTLPPNNPIKKRRPTTTDLITQDLGYCCLEFFFARFPRNSVVADRLGVSPVTIKKLKREVELGNCCCNNAPNCLKNRLGKKTVNAAVKFTK